MGPARPRAGQGICEIPPRLLHPRARRHPWRPALHIPERTMATYTTIEAEARERAGKGAARATRRSGKGPAVLDGAREAPSLLSLDPRTVLREVQRIGWRSRLYEVKVNGSTTRALIRAVQFHPVTDKPEHVDFQRLAAGEKVRLAVTVQFRNEGTSPGM